MVCKEEVRGHQRVYLRRASDAASASASGEGWLIIDDHVRKLEHEPSVSAVLHQMLSMGLIVSP